MILVISSEMHNKIQKVHSVVYFVVINILKYKIPSTGCSVFTIQINSRAVRLTANFGQSGLFLSTERGQREYVKKLAVLVVHVSLLCL